MNLYEVEFKNGHKTTVPAKSKKDAREKVAQLYGDELKVKSVDEVEEPGDDSSDDSGGETEGAGGGADGGTGDNGGEESSDEGDVEIISVEEIEGEEVEDGGNGDDDDEDDTPPEDEHWWMRRRGRAAK